MERVFSEELSFIMAATGDCVSSFVHQSHFHEWAIKAVLLWPKTELIRFLWSKVKVGTVVILVRPGKTSYKNVSIETHQSNCDMGTSVVVINPAVSIVPRIEIRFSPAIMVVNSIFASNWIFFLPRMELSMVWTMCAAQSEAHVWTWAWRRPGWTATRRRRWASCCCCWGTRPSGPISWRQSWRLLLPGSMTEALKNTSLHPYLIFFSH